jgi:hypothetical protein
MKLFRRLKRPGRLAADGDHRTAGKSVIGSGKKQSYSAASMLGRLSFTVGRTIFMP